MTRPLMPQRSSTGTGSVVADSTAATADAGDPLIEGSKAPATVWYRWTAPADGWYEFDTHGSQVSSELGVYTDTTPLQLVDDSAGECASFVNFGQTSAAVKFPATSGTSYLVMVCWVQRGRAVSEQPRRPAPAQLAAGGRPRPSPPATTPSPLLPSSPALTAS